MNSDAMMNCAESILILRLAFTPLYRKGIYFWDALLFLDDEQYKNTMEKVTENIVEKYSSPKNIAYCNDVLLALQNVRINIHHEIVNHAVREIRDGIIEELAYNEALAL